MKQTWGDGAGNTAHLIGYTLVPLAAGAVLVWIGQQGRSIF